MFDVDRYLQQLIESVKDAFSDRLLYVGLQGSYMRDEATDKSDIDVMIILEGFSVADMDVYREILKSIGDYEKSCGFICGREEMMRWNPLEIYQLCNTVDQDAMLPPLQPRQETMGDLQGAEQDGFHPLPRIPVRRLIGQRSHASREKSSSSISFSFFSGAMKDALTLLILQ